MDSSAHTTLVDSEIVEEISVDADLEIIKETTSRADEWIRQCTQQPLTQK
jgi:hypothetical protein